MSDRTVSPIDLLIGVVGHKAAGKDTCCSLLTGRGFKVFRVSDPIRAEAARRGIARPTVAQLQDIGNWGRKQAGPGYWAERLLDMAQAGRYRLVAVNGLRNPGEIEALQKFGCELIGVTAPVMERAARFLNRERIGDPPTLEGFLQTDDRDRGNGEPPDGQQVDRCMAMIAHENVYNNVGTEEDFDEWISVILERALQTA